MVKKLLSRLGSPTSPAPLPDDVATTQVADDSGFFTTLFQERDEDLVRPVSWPDRAASLQAARVPEREGAELLERAWSHERNGPMPVGRALDGLSHYLAFVRVAPDRELIAQDEHGDFLLIVLDGTVAVDRVQPWGGHARLGEARAGDLLGEMSLLDAGTRFSSCRSLTPCTLGVLEARELDRMMRDKPRMAAAVMATLARRLSLRLRQSSARLSALLAQA